LELPERLRRVELPERLRLLELPERLRLLRIRRLDWIPNRALG
jgi:hypothetical protein